MKLGGLQHWRTPPPKVSCPRILLRLQVFALSEPLLWPPTLALLAAAAPELGRRREWGLCLQEE